MKFTVVDRMGTEHAIETDPGANLMEAIRDGGVESLLALCGGSLSCGTCHVYLEPAQYWAVPRMEGDEDILLDNSGFRTDMSRLSCQITLSEALDGMRVEMAPED